MKKLIAAILLFLSLPILAEVTYIGLSSGHFQHAYDWCMDGEDVMTKGGAYEAFVVEGEEETSSLFDLNDIAANYDNGSVSFNLGNIQSSICRTVDTGVATHYWAIISGYPVSVTINRFDEDNNNVTDYIYMMVVYRPLGSLLPPFN